MTPVERIQAERDEVRRLATDEYDAACDAARRVCADAVADAAARRAAALIAANARYYAALAEIVGDR
jgi:hypothetical protein